MRGRIVCRDGAPLVIRFHKDNLQAMQARHPELEGLSYSQIM